MYSIWDEFIAPLLGGLIGLGVLVLIIWGLFSILNDATKDLVTYQDYYSQKGILAQHNLVVLGPKGNELSGEVHGSGAYFIFIGAGTVDGQVHTGDVLKFQWVTPEGYTQFIEVPYTMVRMDYNDKYITPTFDFNFSKDFLSNMVNKNTELINANDVLKNASAVTIHMTHARYETEILPFLSKSAPAQNEKILP